MSNEQHGDEHLVDTTDVEYTEDHYFDAVARNIDVSQESIADLLNSNHLIGSPEWAEEAAKMFREIMTKAKSEAQEQAEIEYVGEVTGVAA